MNMIRVTETGTIWPYSLEKLRIDEPRRSFSSDPSDIELLEYQVFRVQLESQPVYNPEKQKVVEVEPYLEGEMYKQKWEIVELTEEEQEIYYRATHPPQWLNFAQSVMAMPQINILLSTALATTPALAMALPVGLSKASDGDSRVFLNAWQQAIASDLVSEELISIMKQLAVQYDLPENFVKGLERQ